MTKVPDGLYLDAAEAARSFLETSQNPDGGWGYAVGDASTVEATAAASLALARSAAFSKVRSRAQQWLQGAQQRDGGWGCQAEDAQSGWQTAWALLVLERSEEEQDEVSRGVDWLTATEIVLFQKDVMQNPDELLGIDLSLRGWPWLPGQASWVEPTALAVLALAATPATKEITQRLQEAVAYLVDRRCQGGGWNLGNPLMFSQPLPARAHPTAWVLLALARSAPERILPEDLHAVRFEMEADAGASAFALGALALRACAEDEASALSRLQQLQQPDGSWDGNPFHTALAALALTHSDGASL